jgi:hypothetical protein
MPAIACTVLFKWQVLALVMESQFVLKARHLPNQ